MRIGAFGAAASVGSIETVSLQVLFFVAMIYYMPHQYFIDFLGLLYI